MPLPLPLPMRSMVMACIGMLKFGMNGRCAIMRLLMLLRPLLRLLRASGWGVAESCCCDSNECWLPGWRNTSGPTKGLLKDLGAPRGLWPSPAESSQGVVEGTAKPLALGAPGADPAAAGVAAAAAAAAAEELDAAAGVETGALMDSSGLMV